MTSSRRNVVLAALAVVGLLSVLVAGWFAHSPTPSSSFELTFAPDSAWFQDVTQERGLDFVHDAGAVGNYFMPQIMGSGAALFDADNDGLLDVYLLHNAGPGSGARNQFYRQLPDGRFHNATDASGLGIDGYNMGAATGDVNNDGWCDLVVTQYGAIKLFVNQRDGTFRDLTAAGGLDCPSWGTSACLFDYDRDGWLDLVVACYVDYDPARPCGAASGQRDYCHPSVFRGAAARLFRNAGAGILADAGTKKNGAKDTANDGAKNSVRFQDVTIASGLAAVPGPGLGVVCFDVDGDGWQDIFIANDSKPNHLWINRRDGTFAEEAALRGLALGAMGNTQANMGIAVGDVDDNGLLDLFVTHLTEETHALWQQGPRGLFQDRTGQARLTSPRWRGTGFGTLLVDVDHDGALDLAVVNGRVSRPAGTAPAGTPPTADFWGAYAERNQVFVNDGQGGFRDVSLDNPDFCKTPRVARGLAAGMLAPDDGAPALLVTAAAGPARLYKNIARPRGRWLVVRPVVPCSPDGKTVRDAHGALVTVRAGERAWVRLASPAQSYLCSCDPRPHFGLGDAAGVDAIDVTWPDGSAERFPGGPSDRLVTLRQGDGQAWRRTSLVPTRIDK